MPWGWIVFKTPTASASGGATSSNPGLPTDPEELEAFVRDVVENANAKLLYLFFAVGAPECHAIVKDLDNYEKAKAVTDILHATSYTKLLDSKMAKGARGLEPGFRKRRGDKPPPRKRRPKKE